MALATDANVVSEAKPAGTESLAGDEGRPMLNGESE